MDHPAIILVRPQMGENIGAAARAMWNFALPHMRLVAPRDGWPNPRAGAVASGAGRVLDQIMHVPDLPGALADLDFVLATTARVRALPKPVYTPRAAMAKAAACIGDGGRVGVVFGPERAGLENADIARANALISVPVNPACPSLNLAQCVLLVAYEWHHQARAPQTGDPPPGAHTHDPASNADVEALATHYEARLTDAGFFFPPHTAGGMKRSLRNFWSRMPLTRADVRMLQGILRQLVRWHGNG